MLARRTFDVLSSDSWIEPSIYRVMGVRVAGKGPMERGSIGPAQRPSRNKSSDWQGCNTGQAAIAEATVPGLLIAVGWWCLWMPGNTLGVADQSMLVG